TRGLTATNEFPVTVYAAAMILLSKARKNSSCPLRDHTGYPPPPFEISHLLPVARPGNSLTYTCSTPDSSEAYASQRPSGEKEGCLSSNGVCTKTSGFPARSSAPLTSNGTVQMSNPVFGFNS